MLDVSAPSGLELRTVPLAQRLKKLQACGEMILLRYGDDFIVELDKRARTLSRRLG